MTASPTGVILSPRIRLLRPNLEVTDDTGRIVDLGARTRLPRLLTLLALKMPSLAYYSDLASLGTHDNINQGTKELRTLTGIATQGGPIKGCSLQLPPEAVDLHRVLAVAARPIDEVTKADIDEALELVNPEGPCPELVEYFPHFPHALTKFKEAVDVLRDRARAYQRKRILVVDDEVGEDLSQQLAEYDLTHAESYKEFKSLKNVVDFELGLIDLRLSDRPDDTGGEDVIRSLFAAGAAYPIVLMTATPWREKDVTGFSGKHGVVVVTKGQAGTGGLGAVVNKAHELLRADGALLDLRRQLEQQLVELRAVAMRTLRMQSRLAEAQEMNTQWADLWFTLDSDVFVGPTRTAIEKFRLQWRV